MRVSVIIPAHNAEAYLAGAIDSVLGQTYGDVECIVVDDGSTDGTGRLAAGYGKRVRLLSQPNAGPSAARNRGIRAAEGDLIGFLDADDVYFPTKIAREVALLEACPEADAAFCDCQVTAGPEGPLARRTDGAGRRLSTLFRCHPIVYSLPRVPRGPGFLLRHPALPYMLTDAFLYTGSLLLRRPALDRVGGYDTTLPGPDAARDVHFHMRVTYRCRLAMLDEPLFRVRLLRPGGVTSRRRDLMRATMTMYAHLPEALPGASPRVRRQIRDCARRFAVNSGLEAFYLDQHLPTARWLLRQAARTRLDPALAYYLLIAHLPPPLLRLARRAKRAWQTRTSAPTPGN